MEKTEKIKKCLKKMCQTANAHGVPKIFNSERVVIRLMWLICILICSSLCIWMLTKTVDSFFEYSAVTNIDIKPEMPSPFPSVRICSLTPTLRNYTLYERIIYCKFNGINDCTNDFVLYLDYFVSKMCLRFNTSSLNKFFATKSGSRSGLAMTLFDGLFNEPRRNSYQVPSNGLQIYIYNNSIEPNAEESLIAAPGFTTSFAISKIVSSKLTEPYNDCIDTLNTYKSFDSTLYKEIVNSNHSYRQSDCLDFVFIRTISPNVSFNDRYQFLFEYSISNSIDKLAHKFYENVSSNKAIMSQCPFECNSVFYETTIFQADYPSNNEYLNLINKTVLLSNFPNGNLTSLNEFKQSMYSIFIYFNHLTYTQISQQPQISLWNLISSIGGLFGLFMGLSFLSLIDFFETLIEIIFILFERKIRPS